MTTRTFNITALSPILQYDPPQDVPNAVWKSDSGGITLGNLNSGDAGRILMGTGTVTISAFGSGLGFAGSITGVYCTYSAALSPGPGNPLSSSSSYTLPANQTASPSTGMLASFTGLAIGNWEIVLTGDCSNGSGIKVTEAVVEGWVGVSGANVSVNNLDDTDPSLGYSGVDWSTTRGLQAPFYDNSQHYTSSSKASMNYTFSGGTGIIVWASVDNQHGPYAASLHYTSSTYDNRNTLYSSGYNPFLAVPIPYLFVTGLDPGQSYTLVLQNKATNGTYLDLDYIQVYTPSGGGAPPDGGTAAVHALDSVSGGGLGGLGLGAIIGIAVGGGVALLLFIGVIWWCWRRRKIKVDRTGGTRPLDIANSTTGHHHHLIPLTMQGNVLPVPFHPLMGTGHSPEHSIHAAERQGLLYAGGGGGYPSPPSTGTGTGMPVAYSPPSSSSGYDPYANFGGGYPSPQSSSNIGLNNNTGVPTDHVQARRQGKAAELDAARSLAAMRIQNNNASVLMSPTTPGNPNNPNYNPNYGNTNTHSTITQSWDASSHGPSTPGPTSNSNPGGDAKLPDEPPPSYDPTG